MNLIHFLIYKFESAASDYIRKFVWVVLTVYRYFLKVVAFENEKSNKLYILYLYSTCYGTVYYYCILRGWMKKSRAWSTPRGRNMTQSRSRSPGKRDYSSWPLQPYTVGGESRGPGGGGVWNVTPRPGLQDSKKCEELLPGLIAKPVHRGTWLDVLNNFRISLRFRGEIPVNICIESWIFWLGVVLLSEHHFKTWFS